MGYVDAINRAILLLCWNTRAASGANGTLLLRLSLARLASESGSATRSTTDRSVLTDGRGRNRLGTRRRVTEFIPERQHRAR